MLTSSQPRGLFLPALTNSKLMCIGARFRTASKTCIIDPRRACAARVIRQLPCLCVSVVYLSFGASVGRENAAKYSANNEGQKFCLELQIGAPPLFPDPTHKKLVANFLGLSYN